MAATNKTNKKEVAEGKEKKQIIEKVRVQFDFSKESLAKLDELVTAAGATTRAELIRRALSVYTEIMSAEDRGAKLCFREADGAITQVLPLF